MVRVQEHHGHVGNVLCNTLEKYENGYSSRVLSSRPRRKQFRSLQLHQVLDGFLRREGDILHEEGDVHVQDDEEQVQGPAES